MAGSYWYVDGSGNRQGPVDEANLTDLIRAGTVTRDALIWSQGMSGWQPAGEVAGIGDLFPPAPPGIVPTVQTAMHAPQAGVAGDMQTSVETWGLFWRFALLLIATPFILPLPWISALYWRYVSDHMIAPDGRRFHFEGQPGDIWYVFIAQGVLFWIGQIPSSDGLQYAQAISLPITTALGFLVIQWVCRSMWLSSRDRRFAFVGGFWPYVGWAFVLLLSFITIVGWAWVFTAYMRWLCRNVDADVRFDFRGTGWGILWRTLVAVFASMLVIPIPWLLKWVYRYIVTHVTATPRNVLAG